MLAGAGTLTLSAANTFTGGVTLESGTLSLQAQGAAGAGVITFYYGDAANLTIGAGDVPTNLIDGFLPGDTIDLQGIGVATSATLGAGDVLKIKGGSTAISLNLDPSQTFTGESFKVQSDGAGGTLVTAVTTGGDYPPHIFGGGVTIDGADDAALSPLSAVTVADANANRIDTATLTLSSTANGALSNFGTGSYNANTGVYTVSGTAAAITTALDGLVFTPIDHQVAPGSAVDTSFQLTVGDGTMSDSATNVAHVVAQNTPPAWQNVPPPFIKSLFTVPMTPFAGVSLTDPDVGAMETVTITIGGGGTLSLANPVDGVSLTETSTNVYTLTTATPAAESAALQAVTFTGAFNASGFQLIGVGLSASDGTAVTTASTEIMCGAPIISGSQAQATDDATPIAPFGGVTIQDSPEYTSDQVTITVQNGAGVDTDANGLLSGAGLTHVGVGMYTLVAGSPAFLTQEIEALTFTPAEHQAAAGSQVTTNFVISVFNGATTSDDNGGSVTTTETAGPTYRLTTGADTVTGASGNDKIIAKTNTLSAGDQVQGGPGVNTLWLTGAGKFDLRLPATLSGVSRVEAQEGQPAKAGGAYQTVYLRSGLDAVIDVAPALINGANPNAPTITIVGAAGDSSTINLSSGNDIVTVGAAAETIHGGSGIDTIKVTAATIAASIDGGLSGQSVLDVTGGGTVAMGASVTNIAVVNLMASSSPYAFTANGIADLVVDDLSKGADQVTAGAAGQTITGGGAGKLTMIGAAGGGTTFKDASAILSGDSIQNFGAGADVLTLTDMAAASVTGTFTENAQGTAGVLSLTDGTHSAQVTFFGQLAAAGFSGSFANAGFSTAADPVSGTDVTWAHAMAAAAQH
jgi:autotransporter-associated beta strand protein